VVVAAGLEGLGDGLLDPLAVVVGQAVEKAIEGRALVGRPNSARQRSEAATRRSATSRLQMPRLAPSMASCIRSAASLPRSALR
jgi:hypothetical protein